MAASPVQGGSTQRLTRDEARLQTRERLLDAAADVFKRLGYNGASLEAIAEAAGYTKGAIYSNFDTKADLFKALVDRHMDAEIAAQSRQFAGKSLKQMVGELDEVFERQVERDPEWVALEIEFTLAGMRDPEVRERLVAGSEELRDRVGATFDRLLAQGNVEAAFTGRELGVLSNALATGLALQKLLEPDTVDPILLVRAVRRLAGVEDPAS
ncbi:MAG TPA: TetR/AcrR family transcriptional regulator [Longimicrobiales bacterium]|nr:TetR/AcrR family transcriptional regulator [Longimicrobiales bacterium]